MTPADIDELCVLEKSCFSDAWSRQSLLFELTDDNRQYIGLFMGERLVAAAGLFWLLGTGEILTVAVEPAYRQRGMAKKLLQALFDIALQSGVKTLHLEVRVSNRAAILLYESLGFAQVAHRRGYYANPVEDAQIMQKNIDETI